VRAAECPSRAALIANTASTSTGKLQAFEERFERMVQWQLRQKPGLARAQAERDTLAYMAKMPAWRDHPRVASH
jgi:hypothetical protein